MQEGRKIKSSGCLARQLSIKEAASSLTVSLDLVKYQVCSEC